MKRLFIIVIFISGIILSGCKAKKPLTINTSLMEQTSPSEYSTNFSEQSTWILGYFTRNRLSIPPHSEWYTKGYNGYQPDAAVINKLADFSKDNLRIIIVLGTWCPDSRREVPRFLKIIDLWNFPAEKVTFIGVDNEKKAPVGEYEKLDIQRVPTFIFYKNNIETGRIIEVPVTSLEQDMINILAKE